jgi:hypothetical protein
MELTFELPSTVDGKMRGLRGVKSSQVYQRSEEQKIELNF